MTTNKEKGKGARYQECKRAECKVSGFRFEELGEEWETEVAIRDTSVIVKETFNVLNIHLNAFRKAFSTPQATASMESQEFRQSISSAIGPSRTGRSYRLQSAHTAASSSMAFVRKRRRNIYPQRTNIQRKTVGRPPKVHSPSTDQRRQGVLNVPCKTSKTAKGSELNGESSHKNPRLANGQSTSSVIQPNKINLRQSTTVQRRAIPKSSRVMAKDVPSTTLSIDHTDSQQVSTSALEVDDTPMIDQLSSKSFVQCNGVSAGHCSDTTSTCSMRKRRAMNSHNDAPQKKICSHQTETCTKFTDVSDSTSLPSTPILTFERETSSDRRPSSMSDQDQQNKDHISHENEKPHMESTSGFSLQLATYHTMRKRVCAFVKGVCRLVGRRSTGSHSETADASPASINHNNDYPLVSSSYDTTPSTAEIYNSGSFSTENPPVNVTLSERTSLLESNIATPMPKLTIESDFSALSDQGGLQSEQTMPHLGSYPSSNSVLTNNSAEDSPMPILTVEVDSNQIHSRGDSQQTMPHLEKEALIHMPEICTENGEINNSQNVMENSNAGGKHSPSFSNTNSLPSDITTLVQVYDEAIDDNNVEFQEGNNILSESSEDPFFTALNSDAFDLDESDMISTFTRNNLQSVECESQSPTQDPDFDCLKSGTIPEHYSDNEGQKDSDSLGRTLLTSLTLQEKIKVLQNSSLSKTKTEPLDGKDQGDVREIYLDGDKETTNLQEKKNQCEYFENGSLGNQNATEDTMNVGKSTEATGSCVEASAKATSQNVDEAMISCIHSPANENGTVHIQNPTDYGKNEGEITEAPDLVEATTDELDRLMTTQTQLADNEEISKSCMQKTVQTHQSTTEPTHTETGKDQANTESWEWRYKLKESTDLSYQDGPFANHERCTEKETGVVDAGGGDAVYPSECIDSDARPEYLSGVTQSTKPNIYDDRLMAMLLTEAKIDMQRVGDSDVVVIDIPSEGSQMPYDSNDSGNMTENHTLAEGNGIVHESSDSEKDYPASENNVSDSHFTQLTKANTSNFGLMKNMTSIETCDSVVDLVVEKHTEDKKALYSDHVDIRSVTDALISNASEENKLFVQEPSALVCKDSMTLITNDTECTTNLDPANAGSTDMRPDLHAAQLGELSIGDQQTNPDGTRMQQAKGTERSVCEKEEINIHTEGEVIIHTASECTGSEVTPEDSSAITQLTAANLSTVIIKPRRLSLETGSDVHGAVLNIARSVEKKEKSESDKFEPVPKLNINVALSGDEKPIDWEEPLTVVQKDVKDSHVAKTKLHLTNGVGSAAEQVDHLAESPHEELSNQEDFVEIINTVPTLTENENSCIVIETSADVIDNPTPEDIRPVTEAEELSGVTQLTKQSVSDTGLDVQRVAVFTTAVFDDRPTEETPQSDNAAATTVSEGDEVAASATVSMKNRTTNKMVTPHSGAHPSSIVEPVAVIKDFSLKAVTEPNVDMETNEEKPDRPTEEIDTPHSGTHPASIIKSAVLVNGHSLEIATETNVDTETTVSNEEKPGRPTDEMLSPHSRAHPASIIESAVLVNDHSLEIATKPNADIEITASNEEKPDRPTDEIDTPHSGGTHPARIVEPVVMINGHSLEAGTAGANASKGTTVTNEEKSDNTCVDPLPNVQANIEQSHVTNTDLETISYGFIEQKPDRQTDDYAEPSDERKLIDPDMPMSQDANITENPFCEKAKSAIVNERGDNTTVHGISALINSDPNPEDSIPTSQTTDKTTLEQTITATLSGLPVVGDSNTFETSVDDTKLSHPENVHVEVSQETCLDTKISESNAIAETTVSYGRKPVNTCEEPVMVTHSAVEKTSASNADNGSSTTGGNDLKSDKSKATPNAEMELDKKTSPSSNLGPVFKEESVAMKSQYDLKANDIAGPAEVSQEIASDTNISGSTANAESTVSDEEKPVNPCEEPMMVTHSAVEKTSASNADNGSSTTGGNDLKPDTPSATPMIETETSASNLNPVLEKESVAMKSQDDLNDKGIAGPAELLQEIRSVTKIPGSNASAESTVSDEMSVVNAGIEAHDLLNVKDMTYPALSDIGNGTFDDQIRQSNAEQTSDGNVTSDVIDKSIDAREADTTVFCAEESDIVKESKKHSNVHSDVLEKPKSISETGADSPTSLVSDLVPYQHFVTVEKEQNSENRSDSHSTGVPSHTEVSILAEEEHIATREKEQNSENASCSQSVEEPPHSVAVPNVSDENHTEKQLPTSSSPGPLLNIETDTTANASQSDLVGAGPQATKAKPNTGPASDDNESESKDAAQSICTETPQSNVETTTKAEQSTALSGYALEFARFIANSTRLQFDGSYNDPGIEKPISDTEWHSDTRMPHSEDSVKEIPFKKVDDMPNPVQHDHTGSDGKSVTQTVQTEDESLKVSTSGSACPHSCVLSTLNGDQPHANVDQLEATPEIERPILQGEEVIYNSVKGPDSENVNNSYVDVKANNEVSTAKSHDTNNAEMAHDAKWFDANSEPQDDNILETNDNRGHVSDNDTQDSYFLDSVLENKTPASYNELPDIDIIDAVLTGKWAVSDTELSDGQELHVKSTNDITLAGGDTALNNRRPGSNQGQSDSSVLEHNDQQKTPNSDRKPTKSMSSEGCESVSAIKSDLKDSTQQRNNICIDISNEKDKEKELSDSEAKIAEDNTVAESKVEYVAYKRKLDELVGKLMERVGNNDPCVSLTSSDDEIEQEQLVLEPVKIDIHADMKSSDSTMRQSEPSSELTGSTITVEHDASCDMQVQPIPKPMQESENQNRETMKIRKSDEDVCSRSFDDNYDESHASHITEALNDDRRHAPELSSVLNSKETGESLVEQQSRVESCNSKLQVTQSALSKQDGLQSNIIPDKNNNTMGENLVANSTSQIENTPRSEIPSSHPTLPTPLQKQSLPHKSGNKDVGVDDTLARTTECGTQSIAERKEMGPCSIIHKPLALSESDLKEGAQNVPLPSPVENQSNDPQDKNKTMFENISENVPSPAVGRSTSLESPAVFHATNVEQINGVAQQEAIVEPFQKRKGSTSVENVSKVVTESSNSVEDNETNKPEQGIVIDKMTDLSKTIINHETSKAEQRIVIDLSESNEDCIIIDDDSDDAPNSILANDIQRTSNTAANQGQSTISMTSNRGAPINNTATNKNQPTSDKAANEGQPTSDKAANEGQPTTIKAANEGQLTSNKAANEVQPTSNKAANGGQPTINTAANEVQPTNNKAANEGQPTINKAANEVQPTNNKAANVGQPTSNKAENGGQPTINKAANEGQSVSNKTANEGQVTSIKAANEGRATSNKAANEGQPTSNKAANDTQLTSNKAANEGQPTSNKAAYEAQPAINAANEGQLTSNKAANEGQPDCDKAANEGQPTINKAATEGQPTSNKADTEGRPTSIKAANEAQLTSNIVENGVQSTSMSLTTTTQAESSQRTIVASAIAEQRTSITLAATSQPANDGQHTTITPTNKGLDAKSTQEIGCQCIELPALAPSVAENKDPAKQPTQPPSQEVGVEAATQTLVITDVRTVKAFSSVSVSDSDQEANIASTTNQPQGTVNEVQAADDCVVISESDSEAVGEQILGKAPDQEGEVTTSEDVICLTDSEHERGSTQGSQQTAMPLDVFNKLKDKLEEAVSGLFTVVGYNTCLTLQGNLTVLLDSFQAATLDICSTLCATTNLSSQSERHTSAGITSTDASCVVVLSDSESETERNLTQKQSPTTLENDSEMESKIASALSTLCAAVEYQKQIEAVLTVTVWRDSNKPVNLAIKRTFWECQSVPTSPVLTTTTEDRDGLGQSRSGVTGMRTVYSDHTVQNGGCVYRRNSGLNQNKQWQSKPYVTKQRQPQQSTNAKYGSSDHMLYQSNTGIQTQSGHVIQRRQMPVSNTNRNTTTIVKTNTPVMYSQSQINNNQQMGRMSAGRKTPDYSQSGTFRKAPSSKTNRRFLHHTQKEQRPCPAKQGQYVSSSNRQGSSPKSSGHVRAGNYGPTHRDTNRQPTLVKTPPPPSVQQPSLAQNNWHTQRNKYGPSVGDTQKEHTMLKTPPPLITQSRQQFAGPFPRQQRPMIRQAQSFGHRQPYSGLNAWQTNQPAHIPRLPNPATIRLAYPQNPQVNYDHQQPPMTSPYSNGEIPLFGAITTTRGRQKRGSSTSTRGGRGGGKRKAANKTPANNAANGAPTAVKQSVPASRGQCLPPTLGTENNSAAPVAKKAKFSLRVKLGPTPDTSPSE